MNRRHLILLFLALGLLNAPLVASDSPLRETDDMDQAPPSLESEAAGIIPDGGVNRSTQTLTPITMVPEQNPYDQALGELTQARDLLAKGKVEAASDLALQAYDDLMAVYAPRRQKEKRKKLHADRHSAATLYLTSSLAYIEGFVARTGNAKEGRARLGDLRDVAINYPELNKKLTREIEHYALLLSTAIGH